MVSGSCTMCIQAAELCGRHDGRPHAGLWIIGGSAIGSVVLALADARQLASELGTECQVDPGVCTAVQTCQKHEDHEGWTC